MRGFKLVCLWKGPLLISEMIGNNWVPGACPIWAGQFALGRYDEEQSTKAWVSIKKIHDYKHIQVRYSIYVSCYTLRKVDQIGRLCPFTFLNQNWHIWWNPHTHNNNDIKTSQSLLCVGEVHIIDITNRHWNAARKIAWYVSHCTKYWEFD